MVPVVDLKRRASRFEAGFAAASARVLGSGSVLLGPELAALERELAAAFGGEAVGVSSGASALQLVFEALGIGAGDEVIVPAFTAVPTASAVCATGAAPVLVDVDAATATIDPAAVAAALTDRTRAIVVVHLYGRPAPVGPLLELGVPVVEDAAQAHGALCGVSGIAAVYSFYPTKNVGGIGDGGAVVTANADLAATVRRRRGHGLTENYQHVDISQNFRMSELEAAWLRLQLPHLADDNRRRREIARRYRDAAPALRWHADDPHHVVHQCVVRVDRAGTCALDVVRPGCRHGDALPPRSDPAAGVSSLRPPRLPGGRGVGGGLRLAAVLPRADRRRGRRSWWRHCGRSRDPPQR